MKLILDGHYAEVRGRNLAGMYTHCVCVCCGAGGGGARGKPQTFDLAIPANSFTNINAARLDGEGR